MTKKIILPVFATVLAYASKAEQRQKVADLEEQAKNAGQKAADYNAKILDPNQTGYDWNDPDRLDLEKTFSDLQQEVVAEKQKLDDMPEDEKVQEEEQQEDEETAEEQGGKWQEEMYRAVQAADNLYRAKQREIEALERRIAKRNSIIQTEVFPSLHDTVLEDKLNRIKAESKELWENVLKVPEELRKKKRREFDMKFEKSRVNRTKSANGSLNVDAHRENWTGGVGTTTPERFNYARRKL